MTPEDKKSAALKCYMETQRQLEMGMLLLLDINPMAESTKPYEQSKKIHLALRQLIGDISKMRVS